MASWNPWHGCKKISPGCLNCYVHRIDARHERDGSQVFKTGSFDLPLRRNRGGGFKIAPGETVWTCFSSDFLLEEADPWRQEAWAMMKARPDCQFLFITKRIHRFAQCAPPDWGEGYPNVHICCTVENQDRADFRLPIFLKLPIRRRSIVCEPLLEKIDLSPYLTDKISSVIAGGESGPNARPCDYDWILSLRRQCVAARVPFEFRQTGANFFKDGKHYRIPRKFQHSQARRANINYEGAQDA